jgi:hypothetical protein
MAALELFGSMIAEQELCCTPFAPRDGAEERPLADLIWPHILLIS